MLGQRGRSQWPYRDRGSWTFASVAGFAGLGFAGAAAPLVAAAALFAGLVELFVAAREYHAALPSPAAALEVAADPPFGFAVAESSVAAAAAAARVEVVVAVVSLAAAVAEADVAAVAAAVATVAAAVAEIVEAGVVAAVGVAFVNR